MQVMETRKRVLGEGASRLADQLNSLAFTIHGQGRNAQAAKFITECV